MLEKFAEDDRIEQMNAQKRRMKQLEHKRAVEKLIEDRRIQFQRERVRRRSLSRRFGTVAIAVLSFCVSEYFVFSVYRKQSSRLAVSKREWRSTGDRLLNKKDRECSKNTPQNSWVSCPRWVFPPARARTCLFFFYRNLPNTCKKKTPTWFV